MNNSIYGNCTFNDIRDDMHCSIQLLVWLFLARLWCVCYICQQVVSVQDDYLSLFGYVFGPVFVLHFFFPPSTPLEQNHISMGKMLIM